MTQFTNGWRFLQSDAPRAEAPDYSDASWAAVTIPRDWSIAGPVKEEAPSLAGGGFFPTGVGWYRKAFHHAPIEGRKTYIAFDGVMANSAVYLNGHFLGHHPYGYTSFFYGLTPHLIRAVARNDEKVVATESLKTAGKPARIQFSADDAGAPPTPDWNDVRYVTATLVDAAGTRISGSATLIHFAVTGPGRITAVDNGDMMDHEAFQGRDRKLYDGNAVAILRATESSGRIIVTATSSGLTTASFKPNTGDVKPPAFGRRF
ncbi:sugar-binding domain-containing protein [Bryocella elongata]|uniref:sugar-binding domain-containing protein n=1 Tax=Bryocella elongata TaxID=863522 RepID=UPI00135832BA|nr:sugar-binding domain-containing protein [Bryocella elongata]